MGVSVSVEQLATITRQIEEEHRGENPVVTVQISGYDPITVGMHRHHAVSVWTTIARDGRTLRWGRG